MKILPTRIWTFAIVSYDLVSEDVQSALDVVPSMAWTSREKALEAANREHKARFHDLFESEDEPEEYRPLRWGPDPIHTHQLRALDNGDEEAWMVYPIDVQED